MYPVLCTLLLITLILAAERADAYFIQGQNFRSTDCSGTVVTVFISEKDESCQVNLQSSSKSVKEGDYAVTKKYAFNKNCKTLDAGCGTGLVGIELKKCGYSNIEGVDFSQNMLDLVPEGIYKKIGKIDLNKPLKFETNKYDVVMCVGTFTYGHVKPQALGELIRIAKNGGLICFTINEGIYEEYGFDNKIKELSNNKLWNVKEFFKSDYIVNKDVMLGYVYLK
jgi:SAM-dependent methyltransferase